MALAAIQHGPLHVSRSSSAPPVRCIIQCSSPFYRSFVDLGWCRVLNPSNSCHPSSSCSGYTPEIRREFPRPQTTARPPLVEMFFDNLFHYWKGNRREYEIRSMAFLSFDSFSCRNGPLCVISQNWRRYASGSQARPALAS